MARQSKVDFSAYHADIVSWLDQGESLRGIANLLQHHYSVSVTRSQVGHYIRTRLPERKDETAAVAPEAPAGDIENAGEPAISAPASAEPLDKPATRQAQLKHLREQGVLTEEEYQKLTQASQSGAPTVIPAPPPAPAATPLAPIPLALQWPPALPFASLPTPPVWTPDLSLVDFGEDQWTLQDACEGTFIMGATGSGKTSGSGRTIARTFLECGFGGLVLCVKEDESRLWQRYAEQAGRSEQLCIVSSGGPFRFNFLDYECQRPGVKLDWIENITNLFRTLMEVYVRGQRSSSDPFWTHAPNQLLRNVLRIIAFARPSVGPGLSLQDIVRFIEQTPRSREEVEAGSWRGTDWFGPLMEETIRLNSTLGGNPEMEQARRYWLEEFPCMPDKTRASLITIFSSMIDGLFSSDIYKLFCTDTTLIPEMTEEGAIIVVDLPLKTRDFTGLLAQSIWKFFFQKAVERRSDRPGPARRPVFLWADEAQFLYSDYDALFQSTARSSSCATVYLTQNIANFYGIYGGNHDKINGFLGNLNTKIFHANNDQASNTWAAGQIGTETRYRSSVQHRDEPQPRGWRDVLASIYRPASGSVTTSSAIEHAVQPSEFAKLRTGGPLNSLQVDAYFTRSGAHFSNGKHYLKATFTQEL